MTDNIAQIAAVRTCGNCFHAVLPGYCGRTDRPVLQSYETRYTDSDFCGPKRRFFSKRLGFIAQHGEAP